MMHPAIRYLQLGLRSLGYDPGQIDGWYGRNTARAADGLYWQGPVKSSEWALVTLRRAAPEAVPEGRIEACWDFISTRLTDPGTGALWEDDEMAARGLVGKVKLGFRTRLRLTHSPTRTAVKPGSGALGGH